MTRKPGDRSRDETRRILALLDSVLNAPSKEAASQ